MADVIIKDDYAGLSTELVMKRSCPGLAALATGVLVLALAPAASAQVGRRANINRPSLSSPSRMMERIGGTYTRDAVARRGGPSDISNLNRQAGFPGTFPSRSSGYQPAPQRLGLLPAPYRRSLLRPGSLSDFQLQSVSGFSFTTRVDTPLYGWPMVNELPRRQTWLGSEQAQGGAFHQFFGMVPAEPEQPRAATPIPYAVLTMAVEQQTESKLVGMQEQALALFSEVTTGSVVIEEQAEDFRRIIALLNIVRSLDAQATVPCRLLCHATLEEGRFKQAMNNLITAVRRDPAVLRDGPNIASFFGDFDPQSGRSANLDEQMRQHVRPSEGDDSIDSFVLQAYCAWVLGDKTRARLALERAAEAIEQRKSGSIHVDRVIHALRYAL